MSLFHCQTITWVCNGCGFGDTRSYHILYGNEPVRALYPPDSWNRLNGEDFCPACKLQPYADPNQPEESADAA